MSRPQSSVTLATPLASRYLAELSRVWDGQWVLDFDEKTGRVGFGEAAAAALRASPDTLMVRVRAPDAQGLARAEQAIAGGLKRVAGDPRLALDWRRAPGI